MNKTNNLEVETKWIVPPGLERAVDEFINLCKINNKPIIVQGDTGVGKSLFCHIFRNIFEDEYKTNHKTEMPFIRFNCASIENNLLISELFGYEKGAFTGAIKPKSGLIEDANDGVLVLEEIGELNNEAQARLLTFIEDGKFRRLGANEEKISKTRIIGTTFKIKDYFRPDFANRFIFFRVPPIYERRLDILFYMYHIAPDVVKQFTGWQVLCLLTYNWPGNVREINDSIINIVSEKKNQKTDKKYFDFYTLSGMRNYIPNLASFPNESQLNSLTYRLNLNKIHIEDIDTFISKNNLSFSINDKPAFPLLLKGPDINLVFNTELEFYFFPTNWVALSFTQTIHGLFDFCRLFYQFPFKNDNLLLINDSSFCNEDILYNILLNPDTIQLEPIRLKIYEFLSKFNEFRNAWDSLLNQPVRVMNNISPISLNENTHYPNEFKIDINNISDKGIDELRKKVYLIRLEQTGGNKSKAARSLGIPESTYKNRLNK